MARFLCLLIATLFVAAGKPQNPFSSAQESNVLPQQLNSADGAGSSLISNSDGQVPDSQLQDISETAMSFQDPSIAQSAITGTNIMSSSDLIASTPNSCPNPNSKLHKRQNPLQWVWDRIQDNFKSPPSALPSGPSFCRNSPGAFTQEGGSSAAKLSPEATTQDGQSIAAPKPRRVIKNRKKKAPQEANKNPPEPMASGPGGPVCPDDYPQKVCCRDNGPHELFPEWGAFLIDCWDCKSSLLRD